MQEQGRTVLGPSGERFKLEDFLGGGAFGRVYRAVGESGTVLAAKLLGTEMGEELSERALLNEAKLSQEVKHPNVVNVVFADHDQELGPYILMEYLPEGTLKDLLRSQSGRNLTLERAVEIMLDIAQGTRAINTRLVHRDIKPDNILRVGDRFKVADFGISKLVSERTRSRTFKGTGPITHMAPEGWQFDQSTPLLDVYSVGLVFFEILALKHPLAEAAKAPNVVEGWRQAHLFAPLPDVRTLRTDVPLGISQLLARMAAKRPQDRPLWDEVIQVLGELDESPAKASIVRPVVEKAIRRQQQLEADRLESDRKALEAGERRRLYRASFDQLLSRFDNVATEFNAAFQHGKINRRLANDGVTYELPHAPELRIRLFDRNDTEIRIQQRQLAGGALMELNGDVSGNLLWLLSDAEDLYGTWVGCLARPNGLCRPDSLQLRLSSMPNLFPFGFRTEADLHGSLVHFHAMDILVYDLREDPAVLFRDFLERAYEPSK